ncbi:cell division protein FtsQ/DivIB [Anaerococcus hydrogenalis]|uniref:POTRA domain protein, FtsQ-type n=1 Tax=Anaerococcus hydrogenalis ACS-025-V-Sch4 TaxID=879306 RepID=F0H0W0_9FIRM|nr:FtsQ-type POTRA domain-containing protein [Anaerococcus hydrogenalis]EGC83916.1 POTRA domain protein, FtsQ-type [Anaerococcus hydrogenalis ACS-025-V-Sch4]
MSNKNRKRRKIKRKEKLFTPFFIVFLVILSLAILIYNFFNHEYFKISQVFIEGNKVLSDDQILKKLNNPVGKNIVLYDEKESIEKLKKDQIIKKISIDKEMPDKIVVKVKEEYPYMYTTYKKDKYIITNNGKVLDKTIKLNNKSLIKIKLPKKKPQIGKKFTDDKNILEFISLLQKLKYSKDIKEIDLENYNDIGIIIKDIQINFGDLKNYKYKLKLLDSVLKDIDNKKLKAYSISLDKGKNPVVEVEEKSLDEKDEDN